jgi:hypothetical protein
MVTGKPLQSAGVFLDSSLIIHHSLGSALLDGRRARLVRCGDWLQYFLDMSALRGTNLDVAGPVPFV